MDKINTKKTGSKGMKIFKNVVSSFNKVCTINFEADEDCKCFFWRKMLSKLGKSQFRSMEKCIKLNDTTFNNDDISFWSFFIDITIKPLICTDPTSNDIDPKVLSIEIRDENKSKTQKDLSFIDEMESIVKSFIYTHTEVYENSWVSYETKRDEAVILSLTCSMDVSDHLKYDFQKLRNLDNLKLDERRGVHELLVLDEDEDEDYEDELINEIKIKRFFVNLLEFMKSHHTLNDLHGYFEKTYRNELFMFNEYVYDEEDIHPNFSAHELHYCANENCNNRESTTKKFSRCSRCRSVFYCSSACQREDWIVRHKYECKSIEQQEKEAEERRKEEERESGTPETESEYTSSSEEESDYEENPSDSEVEK